MADDTSWYCTQLECPSGVVRKALEWTTFDGLFRYRKLAEDRYQLLRSYAIADKANCHFRLIRCKSRAIDGVEIIWECQTDSGIAYDPREPVRPGEGKESKQ